MRVAQHERGVASLEASVPVGPATERPLACVLGNTDLVRPLGLAGGRCAVVTRPDSPKAYSRYVDARIEWAENWGHTDQLLVNLLAFASTCREQPVLFFQFDADLLFVSRNRGVLADRFRFAIADPDLIEQLVDKTRFLDLAAERGLPVPATSMVRPFATAAPEELPLRFPIVLKPVTRRDATWKWDPLESTCRHASLSIL